MTPANGFAVAPLSVREQFAAILSTGPLLKSDAIVVLSGDGVARAVFAAGLWHGGGAKTVVASGGVHRPPFSLSAAELAGVLMEQGVDPAAIVQEGASQHTYDQAMAITAMAHERIWKRLMVVTSPFHVPRVALTFIRALSTQGIDDLHVVPVAASQLRWFETPDGATENRLALYGAEAEKIERYQAAGHVASYEAGLHYLQLWEGR